MSCDALSNSIHAIIYRESGFTGSGLWALGFGRRVQCLRFAIYRDADQALVESSHVRYWSCPRLASSPYSSTYHEGLVTSADILGH